MHLVMSSVPLSDSNYRPCTLIYTLSSEAMHERAIRFCVIREFKPDRILHEYLDVSSHINSGNNSFGHADDQIKLVNIKFADR